MINNNSFIFRYHFRSMERERAQPAINELDVIDPQVKPIVFKFPKLRD